MRKENNENPANQWKEEKDNYKIKKIFRSYRRNKSENQKKRLNEIIMELHEENFLEKKLKQS